MIVPGVKEIFYTSASSITNQIVMQVLAGAEPDIDGIEFVPVKFIGEPVLDLTDNNENYGSNRKASLSFVPVVPFAARSCAFLINTASGASFIIGSASAVPSVSTGRTFTTAGSANNSQVEVELQSVLAWFELNAIAQETESPVNFDTWREITEEEVMEMVAALPSV